MLEETRLFFATIQDEDRDVLEFLDADYTFVNERLARHYGIAGDSGRAVSPGLAGRHRAGRRLDAGERPGGDVEPDSDVAGEAGEVDPGEHPGHAAVATAVGSGGSQGRAGAQTPPARSATGWSSTGRDPSCASCHRRMDPLGFGLENFDAVGAWRDPRRRPADRCIGQAAGRSGLSRARPNCGPCSWPDATRLPAASPRRCSPTRWVADWNARTGTPSSRSWPGSRAGQYRFSALVLAVVESEPFLSEPSPTGQSMSDTQEDLAPDRPARTRRVDRAALAGGDGTRIGARGPARSEQPSAAHGLLVRSQRRRHAGLDAPDDRRRIRAAADPRTVACGQGRPSCAERV